jgi:Prokaryotic Cytochrome C oxidase subunit IV
MTWSLLMVATLCSIALVETTGGSRLRRYVNVGIIVIAFIKVRWVGLDFMELRRAPLGLRLAFEIWVIAIAGALVGLYLLPVGSLQI